MKRIVLWVCAAAALGFVCYQVSWRAKVSAAEPHWKPFTVAMVESRYAGSAVVPARVENYTFAARGDGSQVRDLKRQIMPNGGWGDMRVIWDLPAHTEISLDPSTESRTTYPYSEKAAASRATPPSVCAAGPGAPRADLLGRDTVLGFDTVILRTLLPGPPGETREQTQWESLALNCFPLKEIITSTGGESPAYRITRDALLIKEGEPSASLFDVPASYVERSPSQVFAERARLFPDERSAAPEATATKLDAAYQSHQKDR